MNVQQTGPNPEYGGDVERAGSPPASTVPVPIDPKLWQALSPEEKMHVLNFLRGMQTSPLGSPLVAPDGRQAGPQNMLPPGERQESYRF